MRRHRRRRVTRAVLAAAVGGPGLLLSAGIAAVLLLGAAGRHPLWGAPPVVNVSEALLTWDSAEVARRIEAGERLDMVYDVRPGFHQERALRLHPLEAAAATGQPELVDLILGALGRIDAQVLRASICIARERGVETIATRLAELTGDGEAPDCRAMPLPTRPE